MTTHLDNAYVMQDGYLVSGKVSQVVEALRDYDRDLDVEWVPPAARRPGQAAFAVVYKGYGTPYILFYVQSEDEFDERVLHRVIVNDQRNGEHTWNDFTAAEKTRELIEHQKWLDEMEQAADIAYHVMKSPLNDYKVNKDLRIKSGYAGNAAHLKD